MADLFEKTWTVWWFFTTGVILRGAIHCATDVEKVESSLPTAITEAQHPTAQSGQ